MEQIPWSRFGGRFDRYKQMPTRHSEQGGWFARYGKTDGQCGQEPQRTVRIEWDVAPTDEFFDQLFRVSRNQIIWGGNYFSLPPTRCFLVWRKLSIGEKFSMAMAEYAWTSFNANAKVFEAAPQGSQRNPRFHPTQKPVDLYKWILLNYAEKGMKILDPNFGSGSSLIAAHDMGFDITGVEISPYYYQKAKERLLARQRQLQLFT